MTTTATPRTRRRTAIRAASLFDGVGTTATDPLIVIEDGRIDAVHVGHRTPVPADAELVDLGGATLLPGLIDTHVHLVLDGSADPVAALRARDDAAALEAMAGAAAAQLRAGVTTVRDLGDRDYLSLALRATTSTSTSTLLPTIIAAGPPITAPGGHRPFPGGAAAGPTGIRAAVSQHVDRGVEVIKVLAVRFAPAELRALVVEAHRHGLPIVAQAPALDAIVDGIAAGVDGLEQCSSRPKADVVAPDDVVAAIVARRIVVGSTVGIAPKLIAAHARLVRAGAVVVAGTAAGIGPPRPHGVLPHGLAQLVELGMSDAEAVRAGTHVAARVCGLGDCKGRIAPGFDADLLAVDGDPTIDIAALRRPVAVFAGGRRVQR